MDGGCRRLIGRQYVSLFHWPKRRALSSLLQKLKKIGGDGVGDDNPAS